MPVSWRCFRNIDLTDITPSAEESEVEKGIGLFSKTVDLARTLEAKVFRDGSRNLNSEGLSNEREKYDVIAEEYDVPPGFSVADIICRGSRNITRQQEYWSKGIWDSRFKIESQKFPVSIQYNWH